MNRNLHSNFTRPNHGNNKSHKNHNCYNSEAFSKAVQTMNKNAINKKVKSKNKSKNNVRQALLVLGVIFSLLVQSYEAVARVKIPNWDKSKRAAIVIDANSGKQLFALNHKAKRYPASLTKIMTLYLLFEALDLGIVTMNTKMKVSKRAQRVEPSKLGLPKGSYITVRDAIGALAIKSANDVAVVVAEYLGRTEHNFSKIMTKKAKSLGLKNTKFANASGLPNRKQHTTAQDMAILGMRMIADFPHYYSIFSAKSFVYKRVKYLNRNKLIKQLAGTDGIKTGYTSASGFNLVSSRKLNNRHVVVVVMGAPSSQARNNFMKNLLVNYINKSTPKSEILFARANKKTYEKYIHLPIRRNDVFLSQHQMPQKLPSELLPARVAIKLANPKEPELIKISLNKSQDRSSIERKISIISENEYKKNISRKQLSNKTISNSEKNRILAFLNGTTNNQNDTYGYSSSSSSNLDLTPVDQENAFNDGALSYSNNQEIFTDISTDNLEDDDEYIIYEADMLSPNEATLIGQVPSNQNIKDPYNTSATSIYLSEYQANKNSEQHNNNYSGNNVYSNLDEKIKAHEWIVQIGASNTFEGAKELLQGIKNKNDSLNISLENIKSRAFIEKASIKGAAIYRARLGGLSEKEAVEICNSYYKKDLPCFRIPNI